MRILAHADRRFRRGEASEARRRNSTGSLRALLKGVRTRAIRWASSRILRRLAAADPESIVLDGQRRAVEAFHRAARLVPGYRAMLSERNVEPGTIRTFADFQQRVPVLDKQAVFAENELRDLCVGGTLDDVSLFFCSSGSSGSFSFGTRTCAEEKHAARVLEAAMHNAFGTFDRKTLLFNALPMGVRVPTHSLAVSDTSVRTDAIVAVIRKLKEDFEQFILIGDHLLLKRIVEEGVAAGVPWKRLLVHCVTGGEYVPESFRDYLANLLGIDPDRPETGVIGISYGLSEVSMTTFSENPHTIGIRRFANENPGFREALCGRELPFSPSVMQTYPYDTYLETQPDADGQDELVLTTLDPRHKIPLIRYRTGDHVVILPYPRLVRILREHAREDLIPPLPLRVGLVWGNQRWFRDGVGGKLSPEDVKEALYADFDVAAMLTGYFRLERADGGIRLLLQMQKNNQPTDHVCKAVAERLRLFSQVQPRIQAVAYDRFPTGIDQDFQRKCSYA